MQLIKGSPPALPGSCYLCSNASRKRYIDMETQVEFHGAMYICELCATLVGRMVDMISEEDYDSLKEKSVQQELQIIQFNNQLAALQKVIDGYDDVRAYIDSDIEPPELAIVSTVPLPERETEVAGGEDGPSGQGSVEGLVDVLEPKPEQEDDFSF